MPDTRWSLTLLTLLNLPIKIFYNDIYQSKTHLDATATPFLSTWRKFTLTNIQPNHRLNPKIHPGLNRLQIHQS